MNDTNLSLFRQGVSRLANSAGEGAQSAPGGNPPESRGLRTELARLGGVAGSHIGDGGGLGPMATHARRLQKRLKGFCRHPEQGRRQRWKTNTSEFM